MIAFLNRSDAPFIKPHFRAEPALAQPLPPVDTLQALPGSGVGPDDTGPLRVSSHASTVVASQSLARQAGARRHRRVR
jgi:hypothetical protein